MKKLIITILILILPVCFSGCSNSANVSIEDNKWEMTTIQSVEENGNIVAYNPSANHADIKIYPNAVPIEMTCRAVNGKITIADETNESVYNGTYKLTDKNLESTIYEITVSEKKGTAATAMTTYHNGAERATLIISIGGYALNFQVSSNVNDTEIGVVFQITKPLENAIEEQVFQSKDGLLEYINNTFSECKYFYVFENNDMSMPTSNLTSNGEDSYSYYTNIEIPEDCWFVTHNIYRTQENTYCIRASLPITTDRQCSLNYTFGKKWVYTITADILPAHDNG